MDRWILVYLNLVFSTANGVMFCEIYLQSAAHITIASHAGVFRRARFSSLTTNACSTENNIPFPLFYLRGDQSTIVQ